MNRKTCRFLARRAVACASITLLLVSPAAAASINYGDFVIAGAGISFLDVTESSSTDAVPLFGPPTPFSIGLDFDPDPDVFKSSATDGSADITDGQLNFMVESQPNDNIPGIPTITISESGDYTLSGVGTAVTTTGSGVSARIEVQEVDYSPLAEPFTIHITDSVQFFLPGDAGVGLPWEVDISANFVTELIDREIDFEVGVTKISVVIDNSLFAISESGTFAEIRKDDFDVNIPEPSSMLLASLALGAVGVLRRR